MAILLHQARQRRDARSDCRQLGRRSRISPPFRMAPFEDVHCVLNTPDHFVGVRLYQRQFVGFSPGMRDTSHQGPLAISDDVGAGSENPQGATEAPSTQTISKWILMLLACSREGDFVANEPFVMYFLLIRGEASSGMGRLRHGAKALKIHFQQ
jgi:hypothetical protein